jgi:RNA polymerase sigma-70 factor (ECF subfamily)
MSVGELIRACAESNDGAAWEEFVTRFQRPISLSIKRTACQWGKDQWQFVDDLLQDTYLKLCADKCRLLLEFAQQHSDEAMLGYIKTIAINRRSRSLQVTPFSEARCWRDRSVARGLRPRSAER